MDRDGFNCQCCGACCRIKDGIVRVSDAEIARIAAFLGMDEAKFIANETEIAPDRKGLVLKSLPDGEEVIESGWFDRDHLPEIPRPGSIARTMLDSWIGERMR